jgi:hypothetical protein
MPSLDTIKLIGAGLLALLLVVGTAVITHKVDSAALLQQQKDWQMAQTKAVEEAKALQAAQDKVSLDAAVAEAAAQQKIVTVTNTITREVPSHVQATAHGCITVGFVRVLNGAILGNGTADLSYAAGQPDDACADTDPRTLALNIVANYAAAAGNAEQLGGLQDWVNKIIAASKKAPN